jgi:hypothetical protein
VVADLEKHDPHSSSLPGFFGTVDSFISRFESVMLAIGVLLMALNTVANVVGRFIFQYSLFFSEELNRILIILITFAGISYAARQGRHIPSPVSAMRPGKAGISACRPFMTRCRRERARR